jgi:hypothetical protein
LIAAPRKLKAAGVLSVLLCLLSFSGAVQVASFNFSPQSSKDPKKDYALIFGTVWGPNSQPVAGVPIRIRRASEKKFRWELMSNSSGEFAQRLPAGGQDYVIQADIKTANGKPKPEVTVHIDDDERKDVGLHLTAEDLPQHRK